MVRRIFFSSLPIVLFIALEGGNNGFFSGGSGGGRNDRVSDSFLDRNQQMH